MGSHLSVGFQAPIKAADADLASSSGLLHIEGVAIDSSVNSNKWQILSQDLDFAAVTLTGAQLRMDHSESVVGVVGKVNQASRVGDTVVFTAEVGDPALNQKILRGYVNSVSVQVDSDDVECSKCQKQTRKEGVLVHLCPGAWEIIHKPLVRELSIVASPAYKNTKFSPCLASFSLAMNAIQREDFLKALNVKERQNRDRVRASLDNLVKNQSKLVASAVANPGIVARVDALRQSTRKLFGKDDPLTDQVEAIFLDLKISLLSKKFSQLRDRETLLSGSAKQLAAAKKNAQLLHTHEEDLTEEEDLQLDMLVDRTVNGSRLYGSFLNPYTMKALKTGVREAAA